MKRIIRLTESDLTRIVRRVIRESKNQRYVDMVLDKISQEGVGSMSEFEKRILDDENIDLYQELLNKIRNEKGTKNLTKLEKKILRDFGVEQPNDPITQSFMDKVNDEGWKIVRQEDRTKLDDAYKFLNDYVKNNLKMVEVVNKNPKYGEKYIDAVFFKDKNDNIIIQFFRENPNVNYRGYHKNGLTFEWEFFSMLGKKFNLQFIDKQEVAYKWAFNMFGEPDMSVGQKDAKFMGQP